MTLQHCYLPLSTRCTVGPLPGWPRNGTVDSTARSVVVVRRVVVVTVVGGGAVVGGCVAGKTKMIEMRLFAVEGF